MQADIQDAPKLAYSVKEACQASSLGKTTIYKHIAAGRLITRHVGRRTLILAESLHALIARDGAFAQAHEPEGSGRNPQRTPHPAPGVTKHQNEGSQ